MERGFLNLGLLNGSRDDEGHWGEGQLDQVTLMGITWIGNS